MNRRHFIAALCVVVIITMAIVTVQPPVQAATSGPTVPGSTYADAAGTCQELLKRAVEAVNTTCNDLSRNKACYGSNLVKANLKGDNPPRFETTGDKASIQ